MIKVDETKPCGAAGHYSMLAARLHDTVNVGRHITLDLSYFQPGDGAKMIKSPKELLYYIVKGEVTVIAGDGVQYMPCAGDSIHINPNQGRESESTSSTMAKMLVISYSAWVVAGRNRRSA